MPKGQATLIILTMVAAIASGCGERQGDTTVKRPDDSIVRKSELPKTSRIRIEAACTVQPKSMLKVKSQASGEVLRVFVETGDRVKIGDKLIEISTRDAELQYERLLLAERISTLRLSALSIQIERLTREALATRQLYSENHLSREESILREKQVEREQAELESRDIQLKKKDLERIMQEAIIRAPASSTVISRTVEPGQIIGAAIGIASGGDVLLELGDLSHLTLECSIHAQEAHAVKVGTKLGVRYHERDHTHFVATISRISPRIESIGGVPQLKFNASIIDGITSELIVGTRMLAFPLD